MFDLDNESLFYIDQCCRWNAHYWTLWEKRDWHALHHAETETRNYRIMRQM